MKQLTDEQLNIAICELLGWTVAIDQSHPYWKNRGWKMRGVFDEPVWTTLPDYISDLNAMHAAEKANGLHNRANDKSSRFSWMLAHPDEEFRWEELGKPQHLDDVCRASRATARQRAIAFLQVVKPELFQ